MEKKKPHYPLAEVWRVVEARGVNAFTATALTGAAALGLSGEQAVNVVLGLKQKDFYKRHDYACRSHDLARRISRETEVRFDGLHQDYFA